MASQDAADMAAVALNNPTRTRLFLIAAPSFVGVHKAMEI
jgi:hypothetical protein